MKQKQFALQGETILLIVFLFGAVKKAAEERSALEAFKVVGRPGIGQLIVVTSKISAQEEKCEEGQPRESEARLYEAAADPSEVRPNHTTVIDDWKTMFCPQFLSSYHQGIYRAGPGGLSFARF